MRFFRFWEIFWNFLGEQKKIGFFFSIQKNIFCRSWEKNFGIASMQKFMNFWFMIFSERFRYACSGFGVVSFLFPSHFPPISLLGLAASGANPILGFKKIITFLHEKWPNFKSFQYFSTIFGFLQPPTCLLRNLHFYNFLISILKNVGESFRTLPEPDT